MAQSVRRRTRRKNISAADGLIRSGQTCAVITGDIIASSQRPAGDRKRLHARMKLAAGALRDIFRTAMPLDVDIYSGDTWQALILKPHLALRAALFYRACLLSGKPAVDTRLAIAIGTVNFVPGKRVSEGDGDAFRLSGRTLESMDRLPRMRFRCQEKQKELAWDTVVQLVDAIVTRHWTQPRSLAMTGALRGWNQKRIAQLWTRPIKQSSVSKHLGSAHWNTIEAAIDAFEDTWNIGQ